MSISIKDVLENLTEEEKNLGYKDLIINGVNYVADMVKVTLGAKGKTVMYRNNMNKPSVTKDGVTVIRHCHSNDTVEQMVIDIVKQASEQTVKSSGDGTTTTAILTRAFCNAGFILMKNHGYTYYELVRELDRLKESVLKTIADNTYTIDTHFDKLLDVASVAANNREIGQFVFDIIQTIGVYGSIELKKSSNAKDRIEKVKGIKFNKGFYAPQFVNDLSKMTWKMTNVGIVLLDDTIRTIGDIMPFLEAAEVSGGNGVLFVVNDIEPTVLQTLINNKIMSPESFKVMFVEHDGFGDRKTEIMNDIAAMTGATVSTIDTPGTIGFAQEVNVDYDTTSILGGEADEELVQELITLTQEKLDDVDGYYELDDNDKAYYKRRLSTLAGGVAVIHVGGVTEVEMLERYDRIEDAVEAIKSAIKKGLCPGGNYVFCNAEHAATAKFEPLLTSAIVEPFYQICKNAEYTVEQVTDFKNDIINGKCLDLITNTCVDKEQYNVYDSAGVLHDAVTNAMSAAKTILSIERVIGD